MSPSELRILRIFKLWEMEGTMQDSGVKTSCENGGLTDG